VNSLCDPPALLSMQSWPRQLMAKWLNFKHTRHEFHHDCESNGAIGLEGKQEDCKQTYRRDIKDSRYKNLASVSDVPENLFVKLPRGQSETSLQQLVDKHELR
jgi:hypothetical protein